MRNKAILFQKLKEMSTVLLTNNANDMSHFYLYTFTCYCLPLVSLEIYYNREFGRCFAISVAQILTTPIYFYSSESQLQDT